MGAVGTIGSRHGLISGGQPTSSLADSASAGAVCWFYERVITGLPLATVWLLAVGGVLYSAGVLFHLWEGLRFHNALWHAFVLAAAACHFCAVFEVLA